MITTDVLGRIQNLALSTQKPLIPLFETIANSIDSIKDSGRTDGRINISIIRDEAQSELVDADLDVRPIVGFEIEDNGIGFNHDNYKSFAKAESRFKRGGRGIGRFMCLKAFESVIVASVYEEGGLRRKREFSFEATEGGIEHHHDDVTEDNFITVVRLDTFRAKFFEHCPKSINIIADKIIEHFLIAFISETCPRIRISDRKTKLELNDHYRTSIEKKSEAIPFKIEEEDFRLYIFRLYGAGIPKDEIHLCAGDRVVMSLNLDKRIPDLSVRLSDDEGKSFRVAAYVLGNFLDATANQERTAFNIENKTSSLLPNEISMEKIEKASVDKVREQLEPFLAPIAASKIEDYKRYVQEKAPEFRSLIKHQPEVLENLQAGLSNEKLDTELHKAKYRLNESLRKETKDFIQQDFEKITSTEDYLKTYGELINKISDYSVDQLAEYVIHRKAIISLLNKSLGVTESGKYPLEEVIHQLIFPRWKSSDDIDFEDQNLWLIDERLSFHMFLNSDLPIKSAEPIASESRKKPDLLIFNKALAYAEPTSPLGSIVIVEFKRPSRTAYDEDDDNPIAQVTNYMAEIRDGQLKTHAGKTLAVPPSLPFYVYIICDITPKIKKLLTVTHSYTLTPDSMGYFDFHRELNAYIEVISYDKLVADAEKRNNVLFKRLNLPPH